MKQAMRILTLVLCFTVLFVSWPTASLARTVADEPVVEPDFGAKAITWKTPAGSTAYLMVVSGPDGFRMEQTFAGGEAISFQAVTSSGAPLADGIYKYELKPVAYGITKSRVGVDDGRDPAIARELVESQAQPLRSVGSISGAFTIQNGAILNPNLTEEETGSPQPQQAVSPTGIDAPADVVHADDVIIQGSLCVGFDCVNGESFGFDTIRMKENNLRIKAQDTSTGSFPTVDWQLTFNESSNGGLSKFSIDEIDGGRIPFTIEAGSDSHSIYVDTGGRIGFGTNSPVVELHVKDGDTPTARLEQDGSSGFTAQTWDVAGNETNFFVRDVTNGSRLPLRIRPGAPTSSIDVAASGNVGVGTASPDAKLHVVGKAMVEPADSGTTPAASLHIRATDGTAKFFVEEASTTTAVRTLLELKNKGAVNFRLTNTDVGGVQAIWDYNVNATGSSIISKSGSGVIEMLIASGGNTTIAGSLTVGAGGCTGCRNARAGLSAAEALAGLDQLSFVAWDTEAVSSLAENGQPETVNVTHVSPDLSGFSQTYKLGLGAGGIAPLDVATVALAAAQALNDQVQAHSAQISSLQSQISTLQQQNATLEARLAALEAALGVSAPENTPQSKSSIFVPSVQR